MELAIARAGMDAVAETDALIREAADWLTAKGEPLWGPNETSYEELVRVTKAGELVTGRVAGRLAACMYLHGEDALFWPEAKPGEAFYVHRLAVARAYAGRGFARAMLDWAENETSAQGRIFLRLDCEPREKLLGLYQSAGFARVDEAPIEVVGHRVVRQQKPILPRRT